MGALWREADLSWKDFLPEGEDVHNFLLEQVGENMAYAYLFDSTYFQSTVGNVCMQSTNLVDNMDFQLHSWSARVAPILFKGQP